MFSHVGRVKRLLVFSHLCGLRLRRLGGVQSLKLCPSFEIDQSKLRVAAPFRHILLFRAIDDGAQIRRGTKSHNLARRDRNNRSGARIAAGAHSLQAHVKSSKVSKPHASRREQGRRWSLLKLRRPWTSRHPEKKLRKHRRSRVRGQFSSMFARPPRQRTHDDQGDPVVDRPGTSPSLRAQSDRRSVRGRGGMG